jgi:hypothetical protein
VLLFLACNRDSKEAEIVGPVEPTTEEVGRGPLSPASLTLPFSATVNTGNLTAFSIVQTGGGVSGSFRINQSGGNASAALGGSTNGSGTGVVGRNFGTGPAGVFQIHNPNSFAFALQGITNGGNAAVYGANEGKGSAAVFINTPTSNTNAVVQATTSGTGSVLQVDHYGRSGNLALFRANGSNRIRFTHSGKGIFNGGTQTGGADVAEAFAVEGRISAYEPGDVLVISTRSDRTVEKTGEPYSTRVIGVYATRPGVLLTERGVDERLEGLVPVGVIGVIPTKVSAENGPIRRGDLLVSAGTPGHAMRGTRRDLMLGAILGKALGEFRGPGTGVIPVLVNVK